MIVKTHNKGLCPADDLLCSGVGLITGAQFQIKSHYGGMATLEEPLLTGQTAKEGLCTQGRDNRGRYNHYRQRAAAASLQQGQGVGNLHLNRTNRLWRSGGWGALPKQPCLTNLFECLLDGWATGPRPLLACLNAALPPSGHKQNSSKSEKIVGMNDVKVKNRAVGTEKQ